LAEHAKAHKTVILKIVTDWLVFSNIIPRIHNLFVPKGTAYYFSNEGLKFSMPQVFCGTKCPAVALVFKCDYDPAVKHPLPTTRMFTHLKIVRS